MPARSDQCRAVGRDRASDSTASARLAPRPSRSTPAGRSGSGSCTCCTRVAGRSAGRSATARRDRGAGAAWQRAGVWGALHRGSWSSSTPGRDRPARAVRRRQHGGPVEERRLTGPLLAGLAPARAPAPPARGCLVARRPRPARGIRRCSSPETSAVHQARAPADAARAGPTGVDHDRTRSCEHAGSPAGRRDEHTGHGSAPRAPAPGSRKRRLRAACTTAPQNPLRGPPTVHLALLTHRPCATSAARLRRDCGLLMRVAASRRVTRQLRIAMASVG